MLQVRQQQKVMPKKLWKNGTAKKENEKEKKGTYLIENSIVYFPFPILMNQIQLHQSTDT